MGGWREVFDHGSPSAAAPQPNELNRKVGKSGKNRPPALPVLRGLPVHKFFLDARGSTAGSGVVNGRARIEAGVDP
jgi:hypothetical protein